MIAQNETIEDMLALVIADRIAPKVFELINNKLEALQRIEAPLGLVTQRELLERLEVTHTTLRRWERLGLRRYTPPIQGTSNIYYKIDDILKFLGVEP